MLYFKTALALYPNLRYIVKADDDVYVLPQRLLLAADQWAAMNAE